MRLRLTIAHCSYGEPSSGMGAPVVKVGARSSCDPERRTEAVVNIESLGIIGTRNMLLPKRALVIINNLYSYANMPLPSTRNYCQHFLERWRVRVPGCAQRNLLPRNTVGTPFDVRRRAIALQRCRNVRLLWAKRSSYNALPARENEHVKSTYRSCQVI